MVSALSSDERALVPRAPAIAYIVSSSGSSMITNELLAALRLRGEWPLDRQPERVDVARGEVLCRRNSPLEFVYFPAGAVVSHTITLPDGIVAPVGLTGWEGFVGEPALADATVAVSGEAWRLPRDTLRRRYETDDRTRAILDRYMQFRFAETTINAACVALHPIDQRLCGTLLAFADRIGDCVPMTHRLVAFMVGATRPTATRILDRLAHDGLIAHQRGAIAIVDRAGLLSRSCRCYARVASYLAAWTAYLGRC